MSEPIKVGDIVRVTDIDPVEQIDGSHLYECEPLNHGTLTDIEAASVMLERAHHRIGELTKILDAAAFLREPSTHEKALKPIGAPRVHRQPNGYDPGARPEPVGGHVPGSRYAWARPGGWAMHDADALCPALRLVSTQNYPRFWEAVAPSGKTMTADLLRRRPATPEETVRFEAELARNTAPAVVAESETTAPTPLAVGQRWQYEDGGPHLDSFIVQIDGDHVYCDDDDSPWWVNTFRHAHPRLRLPEELEPAPAPVSIPLKVGDSFVMETDGPNLVSVAVERCTCSEAQTICPRCLRILRQSEP